MGEISYKPLIDDMVWSFSRLDSYGDCPYRWFLRYIKRYKETDKFYASYGSFIHRILERYYKGELTKDGMLSEFLLKFSDEVKGIRPKETTVQKYIEQGSEYLRNFQPLPFKMISVENKVEFEIDGKKVTLGACCKGSGMIHPNMATMLCFMTTDCKISSSMLQKALSDTVKDTFNMISVDGDTSTNDMVCIMANGLAENKEISQEDADFEIFKSALKEVSVKLSRLIAGDGEGAQRLLECTVNGAPDEFTAKKIAKSIICSSLVKTAMFGADANWGRILCAIGYTEGDFTVDTIDVYLSSCKGEVKVCENGYGIEFSEEKAKEILLESEIVLTVCMNQGEYNATAWGCDLTYDYVKINGDYRT